MKRKDKGSIHRTIQNSFQPINLGPEMKLAHDLKAPLVALRHLYKKQARMEIPRDQRQLLELAIQRLSTISSTYLVPAHLEDAGIQDVGFATLKSIIQESLFESTALQELANKTKVPEVVFYNFANLQRRVAPGHEVCVRLNPADLKSVLFSLFENCFESFEPTNGRPLVKITCFIAGDNLTLEIQDNGRGIERKQLENLGRKRFTQNKPEGHGVGLMLVRSQIQKWNGRVEFSSKASHGTTVTLSLPLIKRTVH